MASYRALSDAVGVLETRVVRRYWAASSEGLATVVREEYRAVRYLVWRPNEVTPSDLRLILVTTIAERERAA